MGIAPFGFQIGHGLLPMNHLTVLVLDFELAIPRNVGEVVRETLHPFRRPDEFHHDLGRTTDHGLQFLPNIGRPSL